MPTYQYACTSAQCANEFELVQSFTDPAASECPVCGGPVRKVFSAVGVVFKGSGFYRTDSRAAAGSSKGRSDSAAKSDSAKSDSAKSESAKAESAKSDPSASGSAKSGSNSSSASTSSSGPSKAATTSA
jgi:putative FmdB family regulatory protein